MVRFNTEFERVCYNCNYFMPDKSDFETGYGACIFDIDKFEPFVDEIFEDNDFSPCIEVYNEKRIDGGSDACDNYEQAEIIEIDDDASPDEIIAEILQFSMKNQSIEKFEKSLISENVDEKNYAINELIHLLYLGNKFAYEALLDYFIKAEPAKTLEEAHVKVKIIEALQHNSKEEKLIGHFIDELLKTPSNNTTRKIFQEIFKYFERRPLEIIEEPLMNYLERGKCSPKLKARVLGIIDGIMERERPCWKF